MCSGINASQVVMLFLDSASQGCDIWTLMEMGENMISLVAFAGSARKESYNRKLVRIAAAGARQTGALVEILELDDYPMPPMSEDLEADSGIPEQAVLFKQKLTNADGFIIASPEYNGSIPPLLKNALDWASRSQNSHEKFLSAYKGKIAVLMSASPGSLGGIRGLVPLRMLLGNLGVMVIPTFRCISGAGEAFNAEGLLNNVVDQKAVTKLGVELSETVERMKNGERR